MSFGRWRLRRFRREGLRGVSLWDRPVAGGLLWEQVGTPRVEALGREGCPPREVGPLLAGPLAEVLLALHDELRFEAVHLSGGLAAVGGLGEALREGTLPFRVEIDPEPLWSACRGGQALLAERGASDGAVLDVGQTSIKAAARGRRFVLPRDLDTLPLRLIDREGRSRGAPTEATAAFVAGALIEVLVTARPNDPCVVLGLPCPLRDDLVPGPCTYGWEGDRRLLPEVVRRVDALLDPWPGAEPELLVLNDAELAAEAARERLGPERGQRVLVVTLGFGPGGALFFR